MNCDKNSEAVGSESKAEGDKVSESESGCSAVESQGFETPVDVPESQGFFVFSERPKVKRLGKDRPSVMEILQSVSPQPFKAEPLIGKVDTDVIKKLESDTIPKAEINRAPSPLLEFRVASPGLTQLIEASSDSSSPVSGLQCHNVGSVPNSPVDPTQDCHDVDLNSDSRPSEMTINNEEASDSKAIECCELTRSQTPVQSDIRPVEYQQTPVESDLGLAEMPVLSPNGDTSHNKSEVLIDESQNQDLIDEDQSQNLNLENWPRSPQKARRGRSPRNRGRGRGMNRTQVLTRQIETPNSFTDSLPDLEPMGYGISAFLTEASNPNDDLTAYSESKGSRPGSRETPTSRTSPASLSRGRKRVRFRGRGRAKCWTKIKHRRFPPVKRSVKEVQSEPPNLEENMDDGLQYEGASPTWQLSPKTPSPSSQNNVASEPNSSLQDVLKTVDAIQSIVSDIQKESDNSTAVEHRRDSTSSKPEADDAEPLSPRGNLKMTIKLFEKNKRCKRTRYSDDDEYHPTRVGPKRQKVESDLPKRSSNRRTEDDHFLDKYRYLAMYSDDSRSSSPLVTLNGSSDLCKVTTADQCTPCRVHVFDFVKCFNIKNLNELNDLEYNKHIRRQIRALEKGTRIAKQKALCKKKSGCKGSASNDTGISTLPAVVAECQDEPAQQQSLMASHLDDIFDDVLSPHKKKKKKRKKSAIGLAADGHVSNENAGTLESAVVGASEQPVSTSETKADGTPRKRFKCRQCLFVTADLPCIQEHILLHEEPYNCSECPATFSQLSQASLHTISAHPNVPDVKVNRTPDFNPNDHFDEIFESPAKQPSQSNAAPGEDKETNYECQLCPFRTDDRQVIEAHLQSSHRAEYQFVCRICDLAFCRKRETMLKHFKKWHPDQPLDFTTAPGVEEDNSGEGTSAQSVESAEPVTNENKEPNRPSSVISIASEASNEGPIDQEQEQERRVITSGTSDDVQVIDVPDEVQKKDETPSVLSAESRPCTYKCLECGAKTDTFDVICAHLEVSHPDKDYSFSCPFCSEYKAKTCSFVAEHIRTAHCEHSGRCMERRLQNANQFVSREYTSLPPVSTGARSDAPPRTDSARSSNQENKSPDDEVMIVDVATALTARPPLQPLSLVHHSQGPPPRQPTPQPEMVQIFPDFSVTKAEYDRYQIFNLKPPRNPAPLPAPNVVATRPLRPAVPVMQQQAQHRNPQSRPMPPLQPRPFIPATYYPTMPMQRAPGISVLAHHPSSMPNSVNRFPHLMQMMNIQNSMAQPILQNGVPNQPH